jgi:hypothetical protein
MNQPPAVIAESLSECMIYEKRPNRGVFFYLAELQKYFRIPFARSKEIFLSIEMLKIWNEEGEIE